jgi:predicted lipid-binding transport protein (Tim44 family)
VSFWRLNRARIFYFGALIVAIVVGLLIGGGTGLTITAIAGAILALTLLATGSTVVFIGREPLGRRRPGPPPEDEGFYDDRD